jgi:hypothetical protein
LRSRGFSPSRLTRQNPATSCGFRARRGRCPVFFKRRGQDTSDASPQAQACEHIKDLTSLIAVAWDLSSVISSCHGFSPDVTWFVPLGQTEVFETGKNSRERLGLSVPMLALCRHGRLRNGGRHGFASAPATLSVILATAPWLRWRFSLRTLLIATTLVAVGLAARGSKAFLRSVV